MTRRSHKRIQCARAMFSRSLTRDAYRRSLVMGISSVVNGVGVDGLTYTYDAISRPTSRNNDTFGYNERGEVVFSRRDAENAEDVYSYDDIGNLLLSAWTTTTNAYTANNLNQYTTILCDSASLGTRLRSAWLARIASPACAAVTREASYDPDGNLTNDNAFA